MKRNETKSRLISIDIFKIPYAIPFRIGQVGGDQGANPYKNSGLKERKHFEELTTCFF